MRTEYILTDEQKKELLEIEWQIVELIRRKSEIYLRSPVRYVAETEEEADAIRREEWLRFARFDQPLIKNDAVVKLNIDKED